MHQTYYTKTHWEGRISNIFKSQEESKSSIRSEHQQPSRSINDKILWCNLERDLINSIQYYKIEEPVKLSGNFAYPFNVAKYGLDIEVILNDIGMLSTYSSRKTGNVGKVKEKMLVTKMVSILTPSKDQLRTWWVQGISFENILIFLATIINIEVPYKEDAK